MLRALHRGVQSDDGGSQEGIDVSDGNAFCTIGGKVTGEIPPSTFPSMHHVCAAIGYICLLR